MKLTELFTSPTKWQWVDQSADSVVANFVINGVSYQFNAWESGQYGNWSIEFENEAVPTDRRYDITGHGSASTVLATVIDIIRNLVKKREIYNLSFMAKEANRMKLYMRIIKTLFPNWKMEIDDNVISIIHPNFIN